MKTIVKDLGKVSITPKDEWDIRKPYERLDLVREVTTGKIYISKKDVPIGIDIEDTEYWTKLFGDISKLEIVWDNDSNMNDIITSGTYNVFGKHMNINDNLPIEDIIIEDTFVANLLVLNSSINSNSSNSDKSVTQILSLDCRHKKGEIYIRTGKGASLDNLSWEKWSTLQRNVNVGEVGSLDDLKENGIYSGVLKQGRLNPIYLAFVCIVINDYFIGTSPRRISQFLYCLSEFDGSTHYQTRVWDDLKGMWSDWEILNKNEISSMIDNAIKGIIADAPEAFDTLKEIANWIDTHGSDVTSIFEAIESLSNELGREREARMYADNTTRSMGVLFGGFSNRKTTADEVLIGYKSIDQNHEGAFSIPAATATSAGAMSANDKKKLDSLSPGGGGEGGVAELMVEVTYSELVALRDNANLVAGMKYRITDYVTTTVQQNTKSANHPFDVIVEAVSENELSELAQAIQHEGDTYFDGNDLGAWQLWYDLDNNTDKYEWADVENGKGVIYRMIDEKKNDCPYDFKNILFSIITLGGNYYYTFSYVVNNVLYDGTVEKRVKNCYNNSIGADISFGKNTLNDNIFKNTSFHNKCYLNTLGNNCHSNIFKNDCYSNIFKNGCYSNNFGNYCHSNIFGNDCLANIFEDNCISNTFMTGCCSNIFGTGCHSNIFGNYCYNNILKYNTYYRKVDTDHNSITLNEEYYDDGTNALVPIKHPDLSTQPSILPYKFMGNYVYEQLIPLYDVLTPSGYGFNKKDLAVPTPLFIDAKIISLSGTFKYDSAWIREGSDYGYAYLIDSINRRDGQMTVTGGYAKIVYTSMPEEGGDYYNGNYYNGNYYYNSSAISKGILFKSQSGITPGSLYDGSIRIEPVAQGQDYYYDIPDDFKDRGYDSLSILIELKNVTDLSHEVPNVKYSIPDIGEEGTILFAFDNYINLGGLVDKAKQYLVIITVEE